MLLLTSPGAPTAPQVTGASEQRARPRHRNLRERVHVGTSMTGSRSKVAEKRPRVRRHREPLTTNQEGLMLERVRTAEVEAPVTGIGTVAAQILLFKALVLGTLGVTQTSRGKLAGVASRAQPQGIIGTISAPLKAIRRVVVICTSCRHTCRGTSVSGMTTGGWPMGGPTSGPNAPWRSWVSR